MKSPIGIMQGRLTPSPDGRLQFFPKDNWEKEFTLAASLGFDCLEWVFEANNHENNPLISSVDFEKIARISRVSGVAISSICADYFMDFPCHHADPDVRSQAVKMLRTLIAKASGLGAKTILFPVLEKSAIKNTTDVELLKSALVSVMPWAESLKVDLALECSLSARESAEIVCSFKTTRIKVYYDVGNATSYGFDAAGEIMELGDLIGGVHIKDRAINGPSMPLGGGGVDFKYVFQSLRAIGYSRPIILQAARDSRDLALENARRNLNFVRSFLEH